MKKDHSDIIPDKTLSICWNLLDKIKLGHKIIISDFAPNRPDLFIQCAKQYADCFGTILFSDDYKEIKKVMSFKQITEKFVFPKD
jgi:hypothetical protein